MHKSVKKYAPSAGLTRLLHNALVLIYPIALFVLARSTFVQLALILIVLSKWRMFAVRPRFWMANIRANAVDIMVAFSALAFIVSADSTVWQVIWTVLYAAWLLVLKPASGALLNTLQAAVGMAAGLCALFLSWSTGPLIGLVAAAGLVCYLAARHFFYPFDEPYERALSYTWGYAGAAMTWLLGHWLLFFGPIAQPAVLLVALGGGLAALYYLDQQEQLKPTFRRQILFGMVAVIGLVLGLSDWTSGIV